jgi:hypothetical protein
VSERKNFKRAVAVATPAPPGTKITPPATECRQQGRHFRY